MKPGPSRAATALAFALAQLFSWDVLAQGKQAVAEIPLQVTYEISDEPLTTEKIWRISPDELNPHRQKWALDRQVKLDGISAVQIPGKETYKVALLGIKAETTLFARPLGPWYHPIDHFRCSKEPDEWFSTLEGVRVAAQAAAEFWHELIADRKFDLSLRFDKISAPTPRAALAAAQEIYIGWLQVNEAEWAIKGRSSARNAEWRHYLKRASAMGICKSGKNIARSKLPPRPKWKEMMAPPAIRPPEKLLARAPARIWDGLYSVRLSIQTAGTELVGQFLLDSGAAKSLISPSFLESQGINPSSLRVAKSAPQRVSWTGGSGLAHRAVVDRSALSGLDLRLTEFLLVETDLFKPPQHAANCCDGVLGLDFLRRFVVEFSPGRPAAIEIWPREGYFKTDRSWSEVAISPQGALASEECELISGGTRLQGVRWNTGAAAAIEIHSPWESQARKAKGPWALRCGELLIADAISPKTSRAISFRDPGLTAGMGLMGRGPFSLDVPHGRIWWSQAFLSARDRVNKTGLQLKYRMNRFGDRELRVEGVARNSPAAEYLKAGLVPGAEILAVDGIPSVDLDLWEISQRLSGARGEVVHLRWKASKGFAEAKLSVK